MKILTTQGVSAAHVSFEPGCRNWWHIHHKGGQILLCTGGRGYYQEWGKEARKLHPAEGSSNEWVEPVTDEEYGRLK